MNVLHISPSFYPASHYGGTIYSGYALCNSLAQISGLQLRVLTTDSDGPTGGKRIQVKDFPTRLSGYDVYYCPRQFGADVSPRMLRLLWPMIRWADVVHLTAVYSPPTIPTLLFCKLQRKPVVWSPRGALQRWDGTTRRVVKNAWDKICNLLCDPRRVELHVTSKEEQDESAATITRASSSIIPNGIDLPSLNGNRGTGVPPVIPAHHGQPVSTAHHGQDARATLNLLYLGRLHPIKGIENLLQALAQTRQEVQLSICGEGEADYLRRLQSLVSELSLTQNVRFYGRVDGPAKENQFKQADVCIVPSFKENFCLVVAEALARAVPVITSTGTPWQGIEKNRCGLWVSNEPGELARTIDLAATMPLPEMGQRGRSWMEREYSWTHVAGLMNERYHALIDASAHSM